MKTFHATLLNPNLMTKSDDLASSGIPYWPTTLAYSASSLKKKGFRIKVIDAFGEKPKQVSNWNEHYIQGLTPDEVVRRVDSETDILITYAGMVHNHEIHLELIRRLKKKFPKLPIITLENTQQVTSYTLNEVASDFFSAGTSVIYTGEPEKQLEKTIRQLVAKRTENLKRIPGLIFPIKDKTHYLPTDEPIWELDKLPIPAWELFPVKNYWSLGYSHGPKTEKKYIPLYTSRGCPFGCAFCTIPQLNNRLWRGRSGKNIADEMAYWYKKWGVTEFHFEDVNPGMVTKRMEDLSNEILRRKLPLTWKIVSGTKIEALMPQAISLMAKAGCRYISISPESGSPKMLKLMNKPFAHDLAIEQIKIMHRSGITTQACFVLGFPGETKKDLESTRQYLLKLLKVGLDEFAPFIMTPIPGSSQWGKKKGYKHLSDLTFSPSWRNDYHKLNFFRLRLTLEFYLLKLMYNPLSLIKQIIGLFSGRFFTKTEMTIHRLLRIRYWSIINHAS